MNHGLRRAATVALWVAGGCLLLVVGFAIWKLIQAAPSKATAQRLTVAQVIAGSLSAASAITAASLTLAQARARHTRPSDLLAPNLLPDDRLINRTDEIHEIVARIDRFRVVDCHGPRGAGKSFLLEHLADVVNGHRRGVSGHPKPARVSRALYYDLADAAGFAEAEAQICRAALGDPDGRWTDFVAFVKRDFKRRRVLLILDNVNAPGLWGQVGGAAYQYLASRPDDRIVFGSIDPVMLSNLQVEHVMVRGLDLDATGELVAAHGVVMSRDDLVELHGGCNGLPLYVRLFTALGEGEGVGSGRGTAVIDEQLIPELTPEARRLISYVSLMALVMRRISLSELERCPLANLEEQLAIAENRTLITTIPEHGLRRFKIHDIVRDTALRRLEPEVSEAAVILFDNAYHHGRLEHAALYAMFADPQKIETKRFDDLLEHVIRTGIKSRNYALLANLHARAHENTRTLRFIAEDAVRADLFCFARASELSGLGNYAQAEQELLSSSLVRKRWSPDSEATDLQADLRFLQADIAHLMNRYDEAALMFAELGDWAEATHHSGLRALCIWGQAHVLRHQGRELERALDLFAEAVHLAGVSEPFAKAYSITGATGIKVLLGAVPDDEERVLADIEHEIAASSTNDGYMLEIWKSQAQVAWFRGRRDLAITIIEAAIERALARNDRLLYNLYFERAEYARFTGDDTSAVEDYRRVLDFGSGNRDRNLIANALLGVVLLELSAGEWLDHGTLEEARISVLRARQMALDADIQITAGVAETVANMLDDRVAAQHSVRLILM